MIGVCLLSGMAAAQSVKELQVFHTNDMHSRVEPFSEDYQDTLLAGKAGMVRRATFIKQQRELHPDLLLFDCGDFSQGTPYYNIYKGEVEVRLMNEMRYDAGTIGNHEFDFGLENMARLFRLADFPIVCANYDVTGTVLEGLVKEYVVLRRNGVKIGVFGLGTQLEGLVAKESYGDVKFEDPVSEAQRIADLLRTQEKCDVVICLSHLGWQGDPYSDVELIENTRGIDVVLGGHSHSYFEVPAYYKNLDGVEVPLQQMGKHAAFVGKMVLTLQKSRGGGMKRRLMKKFVVLCAVMLAVVQAFAQTAILSQVKDTAACRRWVESRLAEMTLKQKIGQLFIHTVDPVMTQRNRTQIRKAIEEYGLGGLLFAKGQINQQVRLTNLAQEWSEIPLLITFDGEWGLAMRLKDTPEFPKNRVLGCVQDDSLIYSYGREVARQLRAIGVQVNFAPVADVDNNPANPVINTRSFGSDPKEVARKVIAYSRGLEDGGVMAVCKHFPGHGDTEVDSHLAVPVLDFDRARLDSIELYPFREAVEAGVSGMMVGHLQVPGLCENPASISPNIIASVLQGELGFSGLVFTDALEMKGIKQAERVCAQALIAGNDMLLAPRNLKREMSGVLAAVKKGLLTEEAITGKCRKVLTYKYALGLSKRPVVDGNGLKERLWLPETDSLLVALDKAAVTVVKDSLDMFPLDFSLSGTVLLSISPSLAEAYPFIRN